MQEEKDEIINNVMDDRSILARLSVTELLNLFGPVGYDAERKPFILVDDDPNKFVGNFIK